jgi:fatty-acyl-CoA synthase
MIDIDVSPAAAVAHCATSAPSAPALISDDETLSRHDVDQLSGGLAGVLAAGGAAGGDRVAYVGRNSPNLLLALLASAHLGAVFVPVNFRLSRDELRSILLHCGAHTVLVDPDFVPVCASIADVVPARRWLVADDGRTPTTAQGGQRPDGAAGAQAHPARRGRWTTSH